MANASFLPRRPDRPPRIAAIGLASWDRVIAVERYPEPGSYAIVAEEREGPGGTTTNAAVALARLGAEVAIRAQIGDDDAGRAMRTALADEGVDLRGLTID